MEKAAFPLPVLESVNGKPTVTSLQVAHHFEKEHFHVVRSIRELECSAQFHESNFGLMTRDVLVGNGALRQDPYYHMTRDGFAFLAMGFTGKRAAQWKEAYIAAFNRMEEQLLARAIFDGYVAETKHDAINFLRLMLIARKSYDGATVLSFLIREAALGHTNPEGWIVQRIADAANHLVLEHSALATQIERLEKFGLVEVRRANGRYQAMRACLSGIHQALTEFDPSIVDQFVTPRVGLTRYLAQQEGLC